MNWKTATSLGKKTFSESMNDNVPRLAAALAYYTTFSLAPLLIIAIGIASIVLGHEGASQGILNQIEGLVGPQGTEAVRSMIEHAGKPSRSILSTVFGFVALLLGATGAFGELQAALNTVWGTEPRKTTGVWGFLRARLLSFLMVLGTGFLLLVSLIASAALAAVGKFLSGLLPFPEAVVATVGTAISFLLTAALFALLLKYIPEASIRWKHAWVGALFTAFLFTVGKTLLGLYLGRSAVASGYGAAGSVIIILLWVYYSSILLLVGAEFTQVYDEHDRPKAKSGPPSGRG